MPFAEGIVEVVTAKEMNEDQFGNTFRRAFKIEGEEGWFSLGGGKKPDVNMKVKGDWHKLSKGDQIEFQYEQNGNYKNVKVSKITLVQSGGGNTGSSVSASSVGSTNSTGGVAKQSVSKPPFEAGIKVGHAINNAVQLAVSDGDTSVINIEARAIEILKLSKSLESRYQAVTSEDDTKEKPKAEPSPAPKPKAKAKPKAVEVDEAEDVRDFEDDIPF